MTGPTTDPGAADPTATRSRTHFWTPPADPAETAGVSGLEFLQLIVDGKIPQPPMGSTLGFRLIGVTKGHATFEGDPGEHLLNPMGTVHGGFMATLLDSALGCAVMTTLPVGRAYTTVQLGVNMVRPAFEHTATLRCEADVIHAGRTTATAEARVVGAEDGKLYAHGTTTCAIFARPGAG